MKEIKDYIIGLDIGTNSCGYVVTDKQNNILKLKGKTAIGARLFKEGEAELIDVPLEPLEED